MALDLQALINAAPTGGTIALQQGQTYNPGRITKRININGNGARITGPGNVIEFAPGSSLSTLRNATIDGPVNANAACILVRAPDITIEDVTAQDSLQYGIRSYVTDHLTLRRVTIRRCATGIQVHRGGIDNLFEDVRCEQLDRMRVDDGGLGTNGAQGLDFYWTVGTTRINRLTVIGARAKTTGGVSWAYDGSAVEGYGACGPVIIDNFLFRDCVNACEVGTSSGSGVPTGWVFRNGAIEGNPDPAPGWDRNCEGFFLRANNGFVIEDNVFENVDDFALNLSTGGAYGGAMGNNVFRNNEIRLKPGPSGNNYAHNRAYIVSSGVNPVAWGDVHGNRVSYDPAQTREVGYRSGNGGTTDATVYKAWTGWSLDSEQWTQTGNQALLAQLAECNAELERQRTLVTALRIANGLLEARLDQINELSER